MSHPAQFSNSILEVLRSLLGSLAWTDSLPLVFDPFAGPGRRLGRLCDDLGLEFAGIDIEVWPGHDHRVSLGNAVDPESYPQRPFVVVTSPTYPNGMSDHFNRQDGTQGYTYRTALGRDLHPDNSGGYGIRKGQKALGLYWTIVRSAVQCWAEHGDRVAVNVKDFVHDKHVYPLADEWADLLGDNGYRVLHRLQVPVPGMRNGRNREARLSYEEVLVAQH